MAQLVPLATTIATSFALIDQFIASLDTLNSQQLDRPSEPINHPSPLHLLTATATALKSSVTKISLLTITTPFTPTAIGATLQPLNTSILPTLVTATLLTSPGAFPESFSKECTSLARACLRDLYTLLSLTRKRSEDGQPRREVSVIIKQNITEATGKVWEDCDILVQFSNIGVAGFVCKKATQWLDLMKDAVKEFEEWDPAEEVGDDPFGLADIQSDEEDETVQDVERDTDRAAMSAGVKDQALKVLSRIPQSIHVVIKQRLQKMPYLESSDANKPMVPMSMSIKSTIDKVLKNVRKISDCIDESAEGMYMGDMEMCLKKAGEARALTIDVVEAVLRPWEGKEKETKEDQYVQRALTWVQQVEPGVHQRDANKAAK